MFLFLDSLKSNPDLFSWVVIPILIFCARLVDVTIGTMRIMLLARGIRWAVAILGFAETLIWIIAIGQMFTRLNNWPAYVAWAGGYSAGNLLGMYIIDKLAVGTCVLRMITAQPTEALLEALREYNIGYTLIDGEGRSGPVKIIFAVVNRKDLVKVNKMITKVIPDLFYSIESVDTANRGIFPSQKGTMLHGNLLSWSKRK